MRGGEILFSRLFYCGLPLPLGGVILSVVNRSRDGIRYENTFALASLKVDSNNGAHNAIKGNVRPHYCPAGRAIFAYHYLFSAP